MRSTLLAILASTIPAVALAAEGEGKPNLLSPSGGLMLWTLLIFIVLMWVLSRFAFKPLLAAVEAREKALEDAIAKAQADREAAAKLLEEQQARLDAARGEAQKVIAEGRATAESVKVTMLEEAKKQQQEMLDRARREIETAKTGAVAELRREAIEIALAGAGKVIGRSLDDTANRKLIEDFLATIPAAGAR